MAKLSIDNFLNSDQYLHFSRTRLDANENVFSNPIHSHDFAEVFWIEEGPGTHLIQDQNITLQRGEMVFIRPSDSHALRYRRGSTFQ